MTDDPLPLIGVIAKLDLKPTDIIVIKPRRPISQMTMVTMDRHMKLLLGTVGIKNEIIILDDLDIEVLSPQAGEAIPS